MVPEGGYRKYVEAAAVLSEITKARAGELVRELTGCGGGTERPQAQQWGDELVDRGRKAAEELLGLVRSEMSRKMRELGLDPEELARQAAAILRGSPDVGATRSTAKGAKSGAKKAKAPAKKTKAGAKKAKAPAKKTRAPGAPR
ncbi:MAG: hypothetical protein ACRDXC_07585 [Acidimicrobiales bacterium]